MTTTDLLRKALISGAEEISREITRDIPDLELHFVLYTRGQRRDEFNLLLPKFENHTAEISVKDLIKHANTGLETSGLIGIATGVDKKFFGISRKTTFVAIASLNLDNYMKTDEALADLYHVTAQALDTYLLVNKKNVHGDGPETLLQPKKNQLALSRSNLQSDIFSGLILHTKGMNGTLRDLLQMRARRTLSPQVNYRPEDYPFVLAYDLLRYAFKNLMTKDVSLINFLKLAKKLSNSFETTNLKAWTDFAAPAQTMAWNGFSEEQILGYALNTSEDPFVKSTANLIAEITHVHPQYQKEIANAVNPYISDEINQKNHTKLTEEVFEIAIIHAMEAESHLPLIRIANNQNEALLKGRMLGWCADALQSAAKTFEASKKKGLPPAPASRVEFQTLAAKTDWNSMNALNHYMVNQRRMGQAFTYDDVIQYCSSRFDMRPVINSLEMTLGETDYVLNLEAATQPPQMKANPFGPTPAPTAAPSTQRPSAAPQLGQMGMMGGGMMGSGGAFRPVTPPATPAATDETKKAD